MAQSKKKSKIKSRNKKIPIKRTNAHFLSKQGFLIFGVLLSIFVIVGICLFDPTINPMSDDALFLVQAENFITKGTFPTFSGVLYSLALSIPMLILGLKFIYYKILSFFFGLVGFYFFYKFFKSKISHHNLALFGVLLFHALNWRIQYYHSSVMTESFFMMAQILCLYFLFPICTDLFNKSYQDASSVRQDLKKWLLIGFWLLVLSMSKNVTIIASLALIVFFMSYGKWKHGILTLLSFGTYKLIYELVLSKIFNVGASGQWATIKYKNNYNYAEGTDDLGGFILRLFDNYNHYISVDFFKSIGWRATDKGIIETSLFLSILFAVFFLAALWHHYKNSQKLFFIGLYLGAVQAATYLALQTHWKQDRMVIAYMPLILIFLLTAFADSIKRYFSNYYLSIISWSLVIFIAVSTSGLLNKIQSNQSKFTDFLVGDLYSGYTPDWQNYLKMADWADKNLDKSSVIAVRKPETSKIFSSGNVTFYGLFKSTQDAGDQVLESFQENKITHLQLCNLRLNPARAVKGQIIGTTYSYARSIENYKAGTLQPVHQIGQSESCTLYAIVY